MPRAESAASKPDISHIGVHNSRKGLAMRKSALAVRVAALVILVVAVAAVAALGRTLTSGPFTLNSSGPRSFALPGLSRGVFAPQPAMQPEEDFGDLAQWETFWTNRLAYP